MSETITYNRDHRLRIIDEATGKVLSTSDSEKELRIEMIHLQKKHRFLKMVKDNKITIYSIGQIN